MSGRGGVSIVLGSVGFGMIVSVVAGRGPGVILGVCLIAGTVAAALLVRLREVHLIIPVPALAYLAASMIVGYIHDRASIVSRTALAVSGLQWLASGFLAIGAATALAIAMTVAGWRLRRQPRRPSSRLDPRGQQIPAAQDRSWDDYYRGDAHDRRDDYGQRDDHGAQDRRRPRDRYGSTNEYGRRNEYDRRDQDRARAPYGPKSRHRVEDDDFR